MIWGVVDNCLDFDARFFCMVDDAVQNNTTYNTRKNWQMWREGSVTGKSGINGKINDKTLNLELLEKPNSIFKAKKVPKGVLDGKTAKMKKMSQLWS